MREGRDREVAGKSYSHESYDFQIKYPQGTQSTPNFGRWIVLPMHNKQPTAPRDVPTIIIVWRDRLSLLRRNLLLTGQSQYFPPLDGKRKKKTDARYSRSNRRKTHSHIFTLQAAKQRGEIVPAVAARSVLRKLKVKNKTIAKPTFMHQLSYFGYLLF